MLYSSHKRLSFYHYHSPLEVGKATPFAIRCVVKLNSFFKNVSRTFQVESGREELKKEREIMQLVAGLQLGSDEVERREVPPHLLRARHAPRY